MESKKQPWEPMQLTYVGHAAEIVQAGSGKLSTPGMVLGNMLCQRVRTKFNVASRLDTFHDISSTSELPFATGSSPAINTACGQFVSLPSVFK